MNPKNWWALSLCFVSLIAIAMDSTERDRFDPESLPPPAAGAAALTTKAQYNCEGVIHSISEDGIRYVRESGGGILLAAELDNKIGFYKLGKYGIVNRVDHAEVDSEASKKIEHALNNCTARHLPSGVYFL